MAMPQDPVAAYLQNYAGTIGATNQVVADIIYHFKPLKPLLQNANSLSSLWPGAFKLVGDDGKASCIEFCVYWILTPVLPTVCCNLEP